MADVLEALRLARALVAQGWTQGANAHTAKGLPVCPSESAAVCWCIEGALARAVDASGTSYFDAYEAVQVVLPMGWRRLASYNDANGRTQAEVVALFDAAIVRASEVQS